MLEPHKSFKFDFYPISEKIKAHCWAFFKVTQLLYGSARIFFCLFFLFVCLFKSLPLIRFPDSSVGKESFCNAGDSGWIPGSERSPGEGIGYPLQYHWASWVWSLGWEDSPGGGHGNPFQYSCLENPHGQRSLVGYCPWGCKELDTT